MLSCRTRSGDWNCAEEVRRESEGGGRRETHLHQTPERRERARRRQDHAAGGGDRCARDRRVLDPRQAGGGSERRVGVSGLAAT